MASQLASYKPSSIVIAISHPSTNTSHIVGGLAKDSLVSIEYPEAVWSEKTLNNGETVRTHSKDNTLRMTIHLDQTCLLYTSPSPRDGLLSRMPSSA